jgi:hypothetical protein
MSKGQPYLTALSYLTLKGQLQRRTTSRLLLFLPFLGGGNRGHSKVSSPPSSTRGVGGERAGWVLPCPPSFPARRRGTRDNPYTRQPILCPKLDKH